MATLTKVVSNLPLSEEWQLREKFFVEETTRCCCQGSTRPLCFEIGDVKS